MRKQFNIVLNIEVSYLAGYGIKGLPVFSPKYQVSAHGSHGLESLSSLPNAVDKWGRILDGQFIVNVVSGF